MHMGESEWWKCDCGSHYRSKKAARMCHLGDVEAVSENARLDAKTKDKENVE
jgi:hypothetical protein